MSSPRLVGLVLSMGLSILSQQPVLPQDSVSNSNATANSAEKQTEQEVAVIYDSQEKIWKRWVLQSKHQLKLYTAQVRGEWKVADQCTISPDDHVAQTEQQISAPVIVYNKSADDGHPYRLWYIGACEQESPQHVVQGNLELAVSADGRRFERVDEDTVF